MEVVNSILRIMSAPEVEEVNDFVGGRLKMLGKHLPPDSPLNGLKLMQLPEKIERQRMIIAALVREGQLIIPKVKTPSRPGTLSTSSAKAGTSRKSCGSSVRRPLS
jgi:Trk K+ transport system NAD-binding subunit